MRQYPASDNTIYIPMSAFAVMQCDTAGRLIDSLRGQLRLHGISLDSTDGIEVRIRPDRNVVEVTVIWEVPF